MVDQQCQDEKRTIAEALENEHVHKVYDQTAHYFRNARYKAWPKVRHFLNSLEPGSLVADIGCGHGKYLDINKSVFTLGCDRSAPLCSIAQQSGHSVVVSDNLRLPFRDACFDVVISIGVVHHFTTVQRRAQALKELGRVLCPGGRLMVYAWAFEQKHRTFKAQDVLVPWSHKHKKQKSKSDSTETMSNGEDSGYDSLRSSRLVKNGQSDLSEDATEADNEDDGEQTTRLSALRSLFKKTKVKEDQSESETAILPCADNDRSIPDLIWQKLQNLLSSRQKEKLATKTVDYQDMLNYLMKEEQRILKPPLEHSVSAPEIDGFAVREFPGSSQPKPSLTKHMSINPGEGDDEVFANASSDSDQDWRKTTENAIASMQMQIARFQQEKKSSENFIKINNKSLRSRSRSRCYGDSLSSVSSDTGSESSDLEDMSSLTLKMPNRSNESHEDEVCASQLHKRYYHVFREGELGGLIETFIPEMEILESFFDHSNWCVVAQKNGV